MKTNLATVAPVPPMDHEAERLLDRVLADYLPRSELDLVELGRLLGDPVHSPGLNGGQNSRRLTAAARAGELAVIGDLDWVDHRNEDGTIAYRTQRGLLAGVLVARAWFKVWLDENGSTADLQSRAATWAAHKPKHPTAADVAAPVAADADLDAVRRGQHLERDTLSLRALGVILGDNPARPLGPAEQMLCEAAQAGRLPVDPPASQQLLHHLGKSRATRAAVREWLCTFAVVAGDEDARARLAAWALRE